MSEDRRSEVEQVRQRLNQWQQHDYISSQIHHIDLQLVGRKVRPIEGAPYRQLERDVERACDLARHWCDLVDHARIIEARGSWLFDQVAQLRISVQQTLPDVEIALGELSASSQSPPLAAAANCLLRAIKQLVETLNLTTQVATTTPSDRQPWEWFAVDAEHLSTALSRRLLWFPELSLSDDGQPSAEALPMIARVLSTACNQERSLRTAFEGWIQKQDYRFVEKLLGAMRDETDAAEISRRYQEALDGSKEALRAHLAETNAAIEQAVVDGIIVEERSEYNAVVVAINPGEVLDFTPRYEELHNVRNAFATARKARLKELHEIWHELRKRLGESHIKPAHQEEVQTFISTALDREDTRVVEESIARITEMLDVGSDLEESWFIASSTRDVLAEFTQLAPSIERWLESAQGLQTVFRDIQKGRTQAELRFAEVPTPRREEAANAIAAWRRLKQQRPKNLETSLPLVTLLRYLGFNIESGMGTTVRIEQRGEDWLHARAAMSVSDFLVKPIPQFGSQTQGHYDVICLWERPGADAIAARLRELRLTVRNVLMFYLGRLTGRQQRDITRTCREQELALAVLDETLLLFLAPERDARLPIFLRCALPFTALNPYTPFQAGDVPPEIFFGRDAMVRELQRPAGSCLVYGGRQLGKSALLRHVLRQFHHPARDQYAWVENMKLIFDPIAGRGTTHVWRALREEFKHEDILSSRVTTDRPEDIVRYVRDAMLQVPQRRVLMMFDESDDFLDADSRFSILEG